MRRRAPGLGWLLPFVSIGLLVTTACSSDAPPETTAPQPDPPDATGSPESDVERPDPTQERPDVPDPLEQPEAPPVGVGAYGVSAGDRHAVEAGMSVLAAGGNAVDAAIATAFAVGVVEPFASGIGGGGAAIVAPVGEEPLAYNYREVVAGDARIPSTGIGIPGFLAGLAALHDEHGSLALDDLLQPAITLAREGVPTSATVADQLRTAAGRLPTGDLPHLFPDGAPLDEGDPMVQADLAATLELLAADGADAFYRGELARVLSAEVDGIDGDSLAAYEVQRAEPARGTFGDYEVVTSAPPLAGTALVQLLQLAEAMGVADHPPGSADHVHTMAMAWRVADRYAAEELGDPDFVAPPPAERTDAAVNGELAATIPMDRLVTGDDVRLAEDPVGNTTHLTVVDAAGTMVSMTNSLSNFWGSGRFVRGFFLNSHLSRVSGGDAVTEPGRRSPGSSAPVVVRDDDGWPVLGIGSPGGRRIPNILSQVLVGWALQGRSLQEAVDQARFHLEGGADLRFEVLPDGEVADDLRSRGYASLSVPEPAFYFGSVQALEVDRDAREVRGARDERREGDWAAAAAR